MSLSRWFLNRSRTFSWNVIASRVSWMVARITSRRPMLFLELACPCLRHRGECRAEREHLPTEELEEIVHLSLFITDLRVFGECFEHGGRDLGHGECAAL